MAPTVVGPVGMRITRYYCPTARETVSLLPDCLASHFPGELAAVEAVVTTVEAARSAEAAADVPAPRHHAALGGPLGPTATDADPPGPCSPS